MFNFSFKSINDHCKKDSMVLLMNLIKGKRKGSFKYQF